MILIEDNDQQTAELSNLDSFSILNVETRLLRNAPTRFLNFLFWLLIWFFQRFWKIFTFFTNQVTNAAIVSCFLMRLWSQWVQLCPGFSVFFLKVGAELQVSIFKLAVRLCCSCCFSASKLAPCRLLWLLLRWFL